jgi:uncharacterized membrane protein YphA (DoxX/SURF4 family)
MSINDEFILAARLLLAALFLIFGWRKDQSMRACLGRPT